MIFFELRSEFVKFFLFLLISHLVSYLILQMLIHIFSEIQLSFNNLELLL
jgi:hypothetical protein